jgi:hypothetical protein
MQDRIPTPETSNNASNILDHKTAGALQKATDSHLILESLLKKCIAENIKGAKMMELAEKSGIKLTYRSMMNKLDAYRKSGLSGLIRKEKTDKGSLKSFSNEVVQKLQELFLESQCAIRAYEDTHKWLRGISIEFVLDRAIPSGLKPVGGGKSEADHRSTYKIQNGQLYQIENASVVMMLSAEFVPGEYFTTNAECLKIGSYASATRYLSGIKNDNGDLLHFRRFGKSSYRLKRQHSIYLDYSKMNPNDLWSADNKKVDIIVIDWDWKSVFRPWLSGFIDVPTRRYNYEITRSANAESISNSFCNTVQKFGLPKEINHDLGKDYLADRLSKLFSSLNIKVRKSLAKNARAKLIESFHNILDYKLKNLPGYTGNKYQEMPDDTRQMLRQFTKAEKIFNNIEKNVFDNEFRVTLNTNLEGRLKKSKSRFLHISEFIKVLNQALTEYEETLHGGLAKDNLGKKVYDRLCDDELICKYSEKMNSPKGRYEYLLESGFMPVTVDPAVVSMFAMNNSLRTVQLKGIQFRDNHYFSPKLKPVLGKKVIVKYTESDEDHVYVFTSKDVQQINSETMLHKLKGQEIINHLEFVCMAEKIKVYDYGDQSYRVQMIEQREEEKQLKLSSNITKITGFEANIHEINKDVEEIIHKNSKIKKLKDSWDD